MQLHLKCHKKVLDNKIFNILLHFRKFLLSREAFSLNYFTLHLYTYLTSAAILTDFKNGLFGILNVKIKLETKFLLFSGFYG